MPKAPKWDPKVNCAKNAATDEPMRATTHSLREVTGEGMVGAVMAGKVREGLVEVKVGD